MDAGLKLKLNDDLKAALRSGDKAKTSTLRLLISAVKYAEMARITPLTDKFKKGAISEEEMNAEISKMPPLTDADIQAVIAKEMKQRKESIEAYKNASRPDLALQEEAEYNILAAYMPQQLSRDKIIAEARKIIAEVGAKGPADKGKVMPKIIAALKGKADGRDINNVVTELLSSM